MTARGYMWLGFALLTVVAFVVAGIAAGDEPHKRNFNYMVDARPYRPFSWRVALQAWLIAVIAAGAVCCLIECGIRADGGRWDDDAE